MKNSHKKTFGFAKIAEAIYRSKFGIDLGEVHYCSEKLEGLTKCCVFFSKDEFCACNIKSHENFLKNGSLFNSNGDKIKSMNKNFMQKPTIFLNGSERFLIVHELSHVAFRNLWPYEGVPWWNLGELQNKESFNFYRKYRTLDEGVAMNSQNLEIFKGHYPKEFLELIEETNRYCSEKFTEFGVGPDDIEENEVYYFIGNVFIRDIWDKKKLDFRSLVTMLKENTPTNEEILEPRKYLMRMKFNL